MEWKRRHLLGLEDLTKDEILYILETAKGFKEVSTRSVKKVPALRGKVIVNLFFEASTRTRVSFELAGARLSADVVNFTGTTSSTVKGETLNDTARNIEAMGVDIVVIRHFCAGAAHQLARILRTSVVNAGDGAHEHPTQALLDLYTIQQHRGGFEGLKVALVGDVGHSRVARSNIWGLQKLGAEVYAVGPPTLVPRGLARLGVHVRHNLDEVLSEIDCFNMLRIQKERQQAGLFPTIREYAKLFGLNRERLRRVKPDALILHPGPINRGVELTAEVADGPQSVILNQVANGLAVRMAVLYLVGTVSGDAAPAEPESDAAPSETTTGSAPSDTETERVRAEIPGEFHE
ncbi:MAG: aspartate carbamoyltransferase catalytic subunit [Planctomycetota bacterium]|nr:aspartate carbamoyltransferase catalytic subunit [Planctomycetota bacterium]